MCRRQHMYSYVESFNGRLRNECLHVQRLVLLKDTRANFEAWRIDMEAVHTIL